MSDRALRAIVVVAGVALALLVILFATFTLAGGSLDFGGVYGILVAAVWAGIGAALALLRPRNAVGWLLLGIGVLIAASLAGGAYVDWSKGRADRLPGSAYAGWVGQFSWIFVIGFLVPRLMLLFPDGRPPSPRWRAVSVVQYLALAGLTVGLFVPGRLEYSGWVNPFGIGALAGLHDLPAAAKVVGFGVLLVAVLGAALSVVVRFVRSSGVERQQMKWVAWVAGTTVVLWVGGAVLPAGIVARAVEILGLVGFGLAPVAVLVAVLRYRLYDVDVVIRKTLVYGASTVVLGVAYVGLVLAGQEAFSAVAGGSNLAIAVSTLVVAALFLPVRSRLQRLVDRRFYRGRYDAERTLAAFGARLREEIELDTLRADLVGAVARTMRPAHAGLWLREEHR